MRQEVAYADSRYGPFKSTHEGLGVLVEEIAELTDAIRSNNLDSVASEALQVAAVAFRLAQAMDNEDTRSRSHP
jgi:NTP pyrophosphatase (non-canonical NTP hydrolase)